MNLNNITLKRSCLLTLLMFMVVTISACKPDNRTKPNVIADNQTYDYVEHIQPILEQKCIACHACYDAPCQLKMDAVEGLDRGATKLQVYDGTRLKDLKPTRLFVDAKSTDEWREKGFYSVLEQSLKSQDGNNNSVLKNMIDLAQKNPLAVNKKIPDDIKLGLKRKNECPAVGEFSDYAEDNPHGGMPLAVSGLTSKEAETLSLWLEQGADMTPVIYKIPTDEQQAINEWESWLNSKDDRTALVARYIYEHLFLGHFYLDDDTEKDTQFYQLIRSYTPSGQAVLPVNTVRPFDDPKKGFYYRLRPITETIVHKTHITYRFDDQRLKRFKELFLTADWVADSSASYTYKERSNPFVTFASIPAKIRYQFMLDNAEYFVRNFIRGPVCRGQIATNVIRDQFWVMFEDPKHELYTNNDEYQKLVNPYLGLPGENSSITKLGSEWLKYKEKRNNYLGLRQSAYSKAYPKGAAQEHIWNGNQSNTNAFLSIFRHHDSASVTKGWIGKQPLTTWLMDYPLLERTYYELVASFDVFGSVSHQTQTRLYFDLIRNGSEVNFLRLLPAKDREKAYQSWYKSAAKIKTEITYRKLDNESPTDIPFVTDNPYREVLEGFLDKYPKLTKKQDAINRCDGYCDDGIDSKEDVKEGKNKNIENEINHSLSKIAGIPAKELQAIKWLPEVSFLRVELPNNQILAYSLLRNRSHSSVSFLLGEELRYEEKLDTLTIIPQLIGSYPNLMFKVKSDDVDSFVTNLTQVKTETNFETLIDKWGVRRMSPVFWDVLHGFTKHMKETNPLESGVYDINRYGRW